jgi:glutathione S-transferase
MAETIPDKLHYIRIPKAQGGRAEAVRMTYVLARRPWTDVLWTFAEAAGAAAGKNPFKQFPFIETASGDIVYQSIAIMHHAGHGTSAWPSDPQRLTEALTVAMGGYDLYQWFGAFAADDVAAKKKFEEKRAPQFFGALGDIYQKRSFAAGNGPTFADCLAYDAIGWCGRRNDVCRHLLESSEPLRAFRSRFEAIPEIEAFLKRQATARQADDSV